MNLYLEIAWMELEWSWNGAGIELKNASWHSGYRVNANTGKLNLQALGTTVELMQMLPMSLHRDQGR